MSLKIEKLLVKKAPQPAIPVYPVNPAIWNKLKSAGDAYQAGLARTQGFEGRPGQVLVVPGRESGEPAAVFAGVRSHDDLWSFAEVAAKLPAEIYKIDDSFMPLTGDQAYKAAVGWALARYKWKVSRGAVESDPGDGPVLLLPRAAAARYDEIVREIESTWLVRDLINAPSNILNTRELSQTVLNLAAAFNAASGVVEGDALVREFPLVHAVGKASSNPPNLTWFSWAGSLAGADAPAILLVGKGVTFDTGGVQIKPGDSMKTMKKDMGGAATALGLARMIMANDLPVRLNVVIPIAENAVSANAFRPGDVITARDGTEIEIGHTDAEGRLILADGLSFGVEKWNPDMILDFATLTGAQRVADGTEVGGVFTNDKAGGRRIEDVGAAWGDDLQLHLLFEKYRPLLRSTNGGELNSSPGGGPGATMAAMFLQHFIRAAKPEATWFHFDVNGMNAAAKPGRPAGGEAMGMRAAYRYLKASLGM